MTDAVLSEYGRGMRTPSGKINGGARPGAGRKPSPGPKRDRMINLRVTEEQRRRFEDAARAAGYQKKDKEDEAEISPWLVALAESASAESMLTSQQSIRFRRAADAEGVSLAAWLIAAAELALARGSTR